MKIESQADFTRRNAIELNVSGEPEIDHFCAYISRLPEIAFCELSKRLNKK